MKIRRILDQIQGDYRQVTFLDENNMAYASILQDAFGEDGTLLIPTVHMHERVVCDVKQLSTICYISSCCDGLFRDWSADIGRPSIEVLNKDMDITSEIER